MTYDTWKATDPADRYDGWIGAYMDDPGDDEPPEEYLVDEWWDDPKWCLLPC